MCALIRADPCVKSESVKARMTRVTSKITGKTKLDRAIQKRVLKRKKEEAASEVMTELWNLILSELRMQTFLYGIPSREVDTSAES